MRKVTFLFVASLLFIAPAVAQSSSAKINGLVVDPSGAVVPGAEIVAVNDATGIRSVTTTNGEGIYFIPNLSPGSYRIQVSKIGFKTLIKPDIILNVEDALAINFTLLIGSVAEVVTIEGGAPLLDTQSAGVSTVVDHTYVENMPLNGRSFQDLILLTPGVLTNSPQQAAAIGQSGEFSVNGQRTESNYYSVDGVSANVGIYPGFAGTPSSGGSLPAATALGTTQGLVSVDALQEFRVQSSTYSAEYGRNPGGQFSIATRSGTNEWHGTLFDYFRNDALDANDWFNNYYGKNEPALRQNDFGGTLGGPVRVPGLYNGRDRTFLFISYEGLRLVQPQAASVSYVPDTALRQAAPAALQPVLNSFPIQNGAEILDQQGNPTGLARFIGTWSNPSQVDAYSVRLDHNFNEKLKSFFRFSDVPSSANTRPTGAFANPANDVSTDFTTRTLTFGANSLLSTRLGNEFRFNYSSNETKNSYSLDNLGGAKAADLAQLQGINPVTNPLFAVGAILFFPGYDSAVYQERSSGLQRQWNLVDAVSLSSGRHQWKIGADYRRLSPEIRPFRPEVLYYFFGQSAVQTNTAGFVFAQTNAAAYPVYTNFSAFAQDEWRVTRRSNLSMGLRWEVNPAPGSSNGPVPFTVTGSSPSTQTLAPPGTPLWKTTWYNFAPRLGATHLLRSKPGSETVVRGGVGVFFDSGQQLGSQGYGGPGFSIYNQFFGSSFPVSPSQANPVLVSPPVAPYNVVYAYPAHLQLPYALQWNGGVEQALGKSQALTVSYVGAHGARLLEQNEINLSSAGNSKIAILNLFRNGLTSDYDAMQMQFQRKLSGGLTALAAYTWSHAIDYGSNNGDTPYLRGNSVFDVRHNFSAAFSYQLPNSFKSSFARGLLHNWGLDDRFTVRTGFPVTLQGSQVLDPATGQYVSGGLNVVPGQPIYVYGQQCALIFNGGKACPGGWAANPNAFRMPPAGQFGDAPRNFVRGFAAWQVDLAVRRDFPLYERLKLQLRGEAFNVFNHPNFGRINPYYCAAGPSCTFGQATATLASSLGVLSPQYQTGGPRSLQLALKLQF